MVFNFLEEDLYSWNFRLGTELSGY